MRLIVHADDYGLTRGITNAILSCVDTGAVKSVSIVPNGNDFAYAFAEIKKRPWVSLRVHLNLYEGKSLSAPETIPIIVDTTGHFRHSFHSLFLVYLFASPKLKNRIAFEVETELAAQLSFVRDRGMEPLSVDSHGHFHTIPFIFDVLLRLSKHYGIGFIRLPREPDLGIRLGTGLLRRIVLNLFVVRGQYRERLLQQGISFNDLFIGAHYSTDLTIPGIQNAFVRLSNFGDKNAIAELLFHPGNAECKEAHLWRARPELARFYFSPMRYREAQLLKNVRFRELIQEMGKLI